MTTRLSGLDASFLSSETEATPMHTLKVLVLERSRGDRRSVEEFVRATLVRAIEALPVLRVRPAPDAGLARPTWQAVGVDLAKHVRIARVWSRTEEAVTRAIAAHTEGTLPRDRPLWSVLVLEHAGSRRLTLALKIHHALVDGLGFARMLEILAGTAKPLPYEGPPELSFRAYARELAALLFLSVRGLARSLAHRQVAPFSGGRWAFNAPVGAGRRIALARLPLEALQRARGAAGGQATINDVLLSLVAGALRRLGEARGEDLTRPLVAAQPVSLKDRPHDRGNQLSSMLAPLHVEIGDARARLAATRASTVDAKAAHAARGETLLARWCELVPGFALSLFWALIRRAPRPPANVVVSNIPGSATRLRLGTARLDEAYFVGPLLPTTGLNVTFARHADDLHVCVLASDAIEPELLTRAMVEGLAELAPEIQRDSLAA